jgi:serine/threonine protein kinase
MGGSGSKLPFMQSELEKEFRFGKVIGHGKYSIVRVATRVKTNENVAIKCLIKKSSSKNINVDCDTALKLEVSILKELHHPAVIKLLSYHKVNRNNYLVFELMAGGELFSQLANNDMYTEGDVQKVVKIIAQVLHYCHSLGIVHRDLKPANVLLKTHDCSSLKIADFGLARHVHEGCLTACGTPQFIAPEIVSGKLYDHQCDIWSLGILIYIMCCGYPPFYSKNRRDLFHSIRIGKFDFDSPAWDVVSPLAKDFITKLLVVIPTKRLTAEQVLAHDWVREENNPVANQSLNANVKNLKLFNGKRHFRSQFAIAISTGNINSIAKNVKSKKKN